MLPSNRFLRFQLIPARGRKPCFDVPKIGVLLFQLIPARGRKPLRSGGNVGFCNISTYPRKGTETSAISLDGEWMPISTYPRKGTETSRFGNYHQIPLISTYPRKGAKTNPPMPPDIRKLYHPRKGAKNSASKKMRSFSFANLNSLFSVGFFSMNRAAAAFSLPWLLYCDKMCYNRANSKHLLQNTQTHFLFIMQFFHNL